MVRPRTGTGLYIVTNNKNVHSNIFMYITIHQGDRQSSNIRHALVGYKIITRSDVVGTSPVGDQWIGQRQLQDET